MIAIEMFDKMSVKEFCGHTGLILHPNDIAIMHTCLRTSTTVYVGKVDNKVICSWGLVPPTVMSDQAYLWLYTTEALEEHKFLFVRHSQRVIERILEEYSTIVGHVVMGNDLAFRWLKWLGATFGEPRGKMVPFRIERHG